MFFSRSKQRLWEKGETTGHTLDVVGLALDCDQDTLLVSARPRGPACHNGTLTCFGDEPRSAATRIAFLAKLEAVIAQRATEKPEASYTARLLEKGVARVAQKVGEEGVELALAGVGRTRSEGHRGIRRPAVSHAGAAARAGPLAVAGSQPARVASPAALNAVGRTIAATPEVAARSSCKDRPSYCWSWRWRAQAFALGSGGNCATSGRCNAAAQRSPQCRARKPDRFASRWQIIRLNRTPSSCRPRPGPPRRRYRRPPAP